MPERIRFHLDEQMDPDIASALRQYGIDVTTTVSAGLRTSDDDVQFRYICEQRRVLVTDDADFLRICAFRNDHPGIVYCRRSAHTLGEIIRFLLLVYEVCTPEEMVGRTEYL